MTLEIKEIMRNQKEIKVIKEIKKEINKNQKNRIEISNNFMTLFYLPYNL